MKKYAFYWMIILLMLQACAGNVLHSTGDIVEHPSGFIFVVPPKISNVKMYELGLYSHDRNVILRLFADSSSPSALSITVWQFPLDMIDLEKGNRLFGEPFNRFLDLQENQLGNHFDRIKIDGENAFGQENVHIQSADVYNVFFKTENDLYVIDYSTSSGYMEANQISFDQFIDSLQLIMD